MSEIAKREPPSQEPVNPLVMVQAALDRGMDAEQIRQFMDLADRHEAKQAKREFDEAMSRFREACPLIVKDADGHNTKYAKLSSAIAAVKQPLADNGLSHSWRTNQEGEQISVTCVVSHIGGHSERTRLSSEPDKSGGKNSIQAIGSAVSYLQRYTLFSILGIASSDMDDDGATAEADLIDAQTLHEIEALCDEVLKTEQDRMACADWLKKTHKVPNGFLRNIPASKAKDVIAGLEKKRKRS